METRDRPELKELPMAVGSYSMLVCEGGGGDGEGGGASVETRDRPELKELPMAVGSYSMLVCELNSMPLWIRQALKKSFM